MNVEKLKKLSEFLSTKVPKEQFDLRIWGKENGLFCGCAIGWAAKEGIFDDLVLSGMKLIKLNRGDNTKYCFSLVGGFIGICKCFDLSLDEANHLFEWSYYSEDPSPVDVAIRIDEFLEGCLSLTMEEIESRMMLIEKNARVRRTEEEFLSKEIWDNIIV